MVGSKYIKPCITGTRDLHTYKRIVHSELPSYCQMLRHDGTTSDIASKLDELRNKAFILLGQTLFTSSNINKPVFNNKKTLCGSLWASSVFPTIVGEEVCTLSRESRPNGHCINKGMIFLEVMSSTNWMSTLLRYAGRTVVIRDSIKEVISSQNDLETPAIIALPKSEMY